MCFHLLDDTLHILTNADSDVGYRRRNGRLERGRKPSVKFGYSGHGRSRQTSSKIKNGQFDPQVVFHTIGKCQYLVDIPEHLLRVTQHAAYVAVNCGEFQYPGLVHLLDGCKRLTLTDGQSELSIPSRGSCDAYADTRSLAQRARYRGDNVDLFAMIDIEQKQITCNRIMNSGRRFRGPVKNDTIGWYAKF